MVRYPLQNVRSPQPSEILTLYGLSAPIILYLCTLSALQIRTLVLHTLPFSVSLILPIDFFPILFHQLSLHLLKFNVLLIAFNCNRCQLSILGIQLTNKIPTRKFSSIISQLMLLLINPRSSTSRQLIVHLFPVIS